MTVMTTFLGESAEPHSQKGLQSFWRQGEREHTTTRLQDTGAPSLQPNIGGATPAHGHGCYDLFVCAAVGQM